MRKLSVGCSNFSELITLMTELLK